MESRPGEKRKALEELTQDELNRLEYGIESEEWNISIHKRLAEIKPTVEHATRMAHPSSVYVFPDERLIANEEAKTRNTNITRLQESVRQLEQKDEQQDETIRQQADSVRQQIEINRQQAETNRQQAESIRQQAESIRQQAESIRQLKATGEENLSSTTVFKADYSFAIVSSVRETVLYNVFMEFDKGENDAESGEAELIYTRNQVVHGGNVVSDVALLNMDEPSLSEHTLVKLKRGFEILYFYPLSHASNLLVGAPKEIVYTLNRHADIKVLHVWRKTEWAKKRVEVENMSRAILRGYRFMTHEQRKVAFLPDTDLKESVRALQQAFGEVQRFFMF